MSTVFRVILEGSQEVPPNDSTASGAGTVIFDSEAVAASYSFDVEGLGPFTIGELPTDLNDINNTHFHIQERGVIGPVVFGQITPNHDDDRAFVTNADGSWSVSGIWETTDNLAPINAFVSIFDSAVVGSDIPLYFNVHTVQLPGGEIRGQLVAIADDIDNVLTGTIEADVLDGSGANDAILGLADNDTINGGNGNDVIDGGGGDDLLTGGNRNDMLFGSVGNDTLMGGKGEDTLDGGGGDDTMFGGKGPDLFAFSAGFGHDIIDDFSNGDHIQFDSGMFADAQAVLDASEQVGDNTVITLDANNDITLVGVTSLQADHFLIV
jgi:serralysin